MILLFILIIALLAIYIGYQLTHAPKIQDPAEGETFTFTVRIPMDDATPDTFFDESNPYHVLNKIIWDEMHKEEEEQE